MGKNDEAEPLVFEAAATAREVLGATHPHTKIFVANAAKMQKQRQGGRQPIFTQPRAPMPKTAKRVCSGDECGAAMVKT